jgi:hypothetical protein
MASAVGQAKTLAVARDLRERPGTVFHS